MSGEIEKAQILYNLLRRKKIGKNYDRMEHLKRFDKKAIKTLVKEGLLISKGGKDFTPISINPSRKEEAVKFVRTHLPSLKGI